VPGKGGRYPFPGRSNQPRLIPAKAGIKWGAHIGGAGVADMGLSTDAVVRNRRLESLQMVVGLILSSRRPDRRSGAVGTG